MNHRPAILATFLAFVMTPAFAEVYRIVDDQGNVTFSDEPSRGAERVDVRPVTTVTLPKPEDIAEPEQVVEEAVKTGAVYESVRLVSPSDGEAFHSGSGDVEFQVRSTPELREGHKYEVTLDGQPVGQSRSGSIMVRNVFRGTHEATVHIVNQNGVRVKSGDGIEFTIHRPSVLN